MLEIGGLLITLWVRSYWRLDYLCRFAHESASSQLDRYRDYASLAAARCQN